MGAATRTYWPSMSDYQEAVQSPQVCFSDKDLKSGTPVLTPLGLPRPICGAFASVYELEQGGRRWAVKCFLRNIPDQHKRYAKISSHLRSCGLPYFVTFDYLSDAILVQGKRFPLVKMEWVEAAALNQYVVANLNNPQALQDLEARWLQLLEDLKSVDIAHGDLQHGNVLVDSDGKLRLIDYDGMWVPALKGEDSHETGHADYQSPLRAGSDFHEGIDEFAGIVIRIALRALAQRPDLWQKYDNGENLLLKHQDYVDPRSSAAFAELQSLGDPEICEGLDILRAHCAGGKKAGKGPKARDQKKADRKRRAEEKRFEEEKRRAQEKRRAAEKKQAEEKRRVHEQRLAEDKRRAEQKRREKEKRRQEHNKRLAEQKRRADEKKRAQKAKAAQAAAARSAPRQTAGPSWVQDHAPGVGTARPAAPARSRKAQKASRNKASASPPPPRTRPVTRPGRGAGQGSTCGLHHLLVHCVAVSPALYLGLLARMDILRWSSWVIVGLACISLLTRLTLRRMHRGASTVFFGLTGLAILGNTVFEVCTVGSYGQTHADIVQYGTRSLLLLACITGVVMGRKMRV